MTATATLSIDSYWAFNNDNHCNARRRRSPRCSTLTITAMQVTEMLSTDDHCDARQRGHQDACRLGLRDARTETLGADRRQGITFAYRFLNAL
jgi:hypothetical protein